MRKAGEVTVRRFQKRNMDKKYLAGAVRGLRACYFRKWKRPCS